MGLGGYALAGALEGLGMSLVKMGEDKKAAAERKRQEERDDRLRAEDRADRREYRAEGWARDDSVRNESREYERGQRAANAEADTNVYFSLFGSESGGNFDADNGLGYAGRSQFGQDRLDDWSRVNGAPRITPADLKGNPKLQEDVEKWHFSDINSFIDKNDLTQYEGQTIGGVKITRSGIIAMAHLGGAGGAKKFLESGGKYNPADAFGTSLSDYAAMHGGKSTDMAGVWDAISDPNVTPTVRNAAASELARRGGLGEPSKLTGEEWIPGDEPDTLILVKFDDRGNAVPVKRDGKVVVKKKDAKTSDINLSATRERQLENRFKDPISGDSDYGTIDVVREEIVRLMREDNLSETEAFTKALGGMVFDQEEQTRGKGWDIGIFDFNGPERTEKVGDPVFTGQFNYGDKKPRGLGDPNATADAPTLPEEPGSPTVSQEQAIAEARAAIAQGANRNDVIARLREMGIDPRGI